MKKIKLIVMGIMIFGPMAALADPIITLDDEDYKVGLMYDGRIYLHTYLMSTPWYGDYDAAMAAASQIGDYFGTQNGDSYGPYFVYHIEFGSDGTFFNSVTGNVEVDTNLPKYSRRVYAIKAVPEPGTLALFGLGLAGLGMSRRQRKTAGV